nr:uncharacterized protein LOC111518116 [Leptinotarsa decemlineata]
MEFMYYSIFCITAALSTHSQPIPDGSKTNLGLWNTRGVLLIPLEAIVYEKLPVHRVTKRQVVPDIGTIDDSEEEVVFDAENFVEDQPVSDSSDDSGRYFYRHFRPVHPLSNYADGYDEFPTTF